MDSKNKAKSKLTIFFSQYFKLIALLVMVAILVAGYFLLLDPKFKEYQELKEVELNSRIMTYEYLEKHLADLGILKENFEELSAKDLSRLDMVLPKERDLPGLFVQMEKLAEENNFILLNINFTEKPDKNKNQAETDLNRIKKLDISINIAGGSYASLIRFLDDLEYNLRLMDVVSINFTADQSVYSINLTTYYLAN